VGVADCVLFVNSSVESGWWVVDGARGAENWWMGAWRPRIRWTWQPKGPRRKDASVRTLPLILAHQQLYYYANTYKI